jgi:hypothetical protein
MSKLFQFWIYLYTPVVDGGMSRLEIIVAMEDFLLSGEVNGRLPSGLRFLLQIFYDSGENSIEITIITINKMS